MVKALVLWLDEKLRGRVLVWAILRGQYSEPPNWQVAVEMVILVAVVSAPLVWVEILVLRHFQL